MRIAAMLPAICNVSTVALFMVNLVYCKNDNTIIPKIVSNGKVTFQLKNMMFTTLIGVQIFKILVQESYER